MLRHWTRQKRGLGLFLAILLVGLFSLPVGADPPAKKRAKDKGPSAKKRVRQADPPAKKRAKDKGPSTKKRARQGEPPSKKRMKDATVPSTKKRANKDRAARAKSPFAPVGKSRTPRVRPRKSYVQTRRDYGHVQVTRRHRRDDGRLHTRPILVRSARIGSVVLNRFQDRRRDQVRLVIHHFRTGQRARALEVWRTFVDDLVGYHEPIDLDEIMLYVAREGCTYENDVFLFHASKLEFLRESEERLEDYMDRLYDQREACERGTRPCSFTTLRNLENELVHTQSDLEILRIEARAADRAFEEIIESSRDYEHQFATVFEDMYREVEVRITLSP